MFSSNNNAVTILSCIFVEVTVVFYDIAALCVCKCVSVVSNWTESTCLFLLLTLDQFNKQSTVAAGCTTVLPCLKVQVANNIVLITSQKHSCSFERESRVQLLFFTWHSTAHTDITADCNKEGKPKILITVSGKAVNTPNQLRERERERERNWELTLNFTILLTLPQCK